MANADLLTDAEQLLIRQGVAMGIVEIVIAELRRRYGGDRHYVQRIERQRRDETIAAGLSSGLPMETVAQRSGCSIGTVQRVKNEWML